MTPIPTLEQLRNRAHYLLQKHMAAGKEAAPVQVNAIEAGLRRETNRVLSFMHAGVAEGLLKWFRDHIARQAVPINATGAYLDDWCETYKIKTKTAERAAGSATGTGTPGAVLPATQTLQSASGRTYTATADITVGNDGTLQGSFQATEAGQDGNALAGVKLRLTNPVPGISNELTINQNGFNGGADKEKDADRLLRLLARIQNPPHGGNPNDYAMWAMEVPGVTRAWGYRTPYGPCTAGVAFLMDRNDNNGIPNPADREAVYDYIRHPDVGPPDELFVFELTPKVINIPITSLKPNTLAVKEAVRAELADLFLRFRRPGSEIAGGTLPISHIREAISRAAGEQDYTLGIHSDIAIGEREVPVPGEITFP